MSDFEMPPDGLLEENPESVPAAGTPVPGNRGLASVASHNAMVAVLGRFSTLAVSIILTPFVLHKLGRELYGVVVAVTAVFEYMSLIRGGVGGALRRYVTLHLHGGRLQAARDFYAAGFWWSNILRTVILVVGVALAVPLCGFLRLPAAVRPDAAVGIGLVFLAAVIADQGNVFSIPIFATGRTVWLSIVSAAGAWGRLGLTFLALSLLVPTLRVYGSVLAVTQLASVVALMVLAQRTRVVGPVLPRPQLGSPQLRRELFSYGGLALLSQAASLLYVSTDNLFIGRLYGASAVTQYSLGTRWAPLITGFLAAAMSGLMPLFTSLEARGEEARSRAALVRVVAITAALSVPICLVPCVVGDLFLVRWVGPEYRSSYWYLLAMLAPATLDNALGPIWMALIARGRIGWIATSDIVVAVGNVAISLLLAQVFHLGLLGFALGNTIATLSKNLLLRPLMGRKDSAMPSMKASLSPLVWALLGSAPGLLLLGLTRPWYGGSLAGVIIAGLAGGAICLAGSLLAAVRLAELRKLRRLLPGGRRA
jgi:O-antigen/teichoic acid export membrane protein